MKILITGTSGFIGSRLLEAVCREYGPNNVVALSSSAKAQCATIIYDPSDFSLIQSETELIQSTEVLIHAGAFTPKSGRDANCLAGCNGNIAFTDKLFKLPFKKLKRILYLSTIDVYAPSELISESTLTMPTTLYGQSKLYCERLADLFAKESNIKCQILRVGHIFGPGEEAYQKFLPKAIRNILKGDRVELWGDGTELRSYLYIDDAIRAILAALCQPDVNETINLVSGRAISIRQMLDQLIQISRKQIQIVQKETGDVQRDLVFDNRRMRTLLLSEETDFLTGLRAEYTHIKSLR